MQVKFLLRQSIVVSLTLTASLKQWGGKQRKMANASEKVDIEIGTSDYDDTENRNVNGCKPRNYQAG